MKVKRILITLVVMVTVVLGAGAVILGSWLNKDTSVVPDDINALTPSNCDLKVTTDNPLNDPNMGINNDGPYQIPEYCPGNGGEIRVSTGGRLHLYVSRDDLVIKINDIAQTIVNGDVDTNIIVGEGDLVTFFASVLPNIDSGIGWANPTGDICGTSEWGVASIKPLVDKAIEDNSIIIERQCWGDTPVGVSDFDFDDFQVVVAVEPVDNILAEVGQILPTNELVTGQDEEVFNTQAVLEESVNTAELDVSPKICGESSSCNSDTDCVLGNICLPVNNVNRCVAFICATDRNLNDVCEQNLCLAKKLIEVSKTVAISCVAGQNKERLSYTIILTNPSGNVENRSEISVIDNLDLQMQSEYVIRTSIPYGGTYNNGSITWNGLSLTPNGGRLEIRYDAIVPMSEFGKEYVNSVSVSESGVVRGGQTIKTRIEVLPCTALISDQADRIIIGIAFIIFGLTMYKIGIDKKVGNYIWNLFGRDVMSNINKNPRNQLLKKDKEDYEKRLR